MKFLYRLSCYGPDAYIFSIPLRTTDAWLKRNLKRDNIINAVPLTKAQVWLLRPKLPPGVEVCYFAQLEYYLEGTLLTKA